jgi:glycosyltransferase involved in cell wall biosynthesis
VALSSEEDSILLGARDNIRVIPNGFDIPEASLSRRTSRLGFIGSLDYWANRDGLGWFLGDIWPAVTRRSPNMTLRIMGKGPPMPGFEQPGVEPLGYIEDTAAEWASWTALVVPLRIGGGTRIKILEAFARRCPVISTSLGAYGLQAEDGLHYLKAETPADFAKAVARLANNPDLQDTLTAAAHDHFLRNFTWEKIKAKIVDWVRDLTGSL